MITYVYDSDLEFLGKVKSEDLNNLVHSITNRLTEELTKHELYKQYYPDHHKYWQLIAAEIQRFGSNTFSTLLRGGKGVKYKEVLTDVCNRMKVNYDKDSSIDKIEYSFLAKVFADTVEKMSPEELKSFAESIGADNDDIHSLIKNELTPEKLDGVSLKNINNEYILKQLLVRGFPLAGIADFLTGPIGWGAAGIWIANSIAGPAYGVTIPAVIHVTVLRKKYLKPL